MSPHKPISLTDAVLETHREHEQALSQPEAPPNEQSADCGHPDGGESALIDPPVAED